MDKIIIFGIGQTSEIVSSYIEESEQFEIIGYTIDSESELKETKFKAAAFMQIMKEFE